MRRVLTASAAAALAVIVALTTSGYGGECDSSSDQQNWQDGTTGRC